RRRRWHDAPLVEIVDAQLHLNLLGADAALAAMDALGIAAVLVDEYWGPDRFGHDVDGVFRRLYPASELAVSLHPDRFAYLVPHAADDPELEQLIREHRICARP